MTDAHRRHLRNYLLDPKLQLRYTLIMVVLSSLLTAGLGSIWYQQMRETSRIIEVKALTTMTDQEIKVLQDDIAVQDRFRLLVLVGFGVLFAFAVAGYGIILTHKVAGPLFKITLYMKKVKEGNLGPIYDLRKGDQLHDFFESFKQMHTSLRRECEQQVKILDEMITAAERHLTQQDPRETGEISRHLDELRKLRDRKKESLKA